MGAQWRKNTQPPLPPPSSLSLSLSKPTRGWTGRKYRIIIAKKSAPWTFGANCVLARCNALRVWEWETRTNMSKASETFDEELFETRLEALKDTQECIQQMSNWCLQHRLNHKKIIQCWLNVFKRGEYEQFVPKEANYHSPPPSFPPWQFALTIALSCSIWLTMSYSTASGSATNSLNAGPQRCSEPPQWCGKYQLAYTL